MLTSLISGDVNVHLPSPRQDVKLSHCRSCVAFLMQIKLKIGEVETKSIEISVSEVSVSSLSDCNVTIQLLV